MYFFSAGITTQYNKIFIIISTKMPKLRVCCMLFKGYSLFWALETAPFRVQKCGRIWIYFSIKAHSLRFYMSQTSLPNLHLTTHVLHEPPPFPQKYSCIPTLIWRLINHLCMYGIVINTSFSSSSWKFELGFADRSYRVTLKTEKPLFKKLRKLT